MSRSKPPLKKPDFALPAHRVPKKVFAIGLSKGRLHVLTTAWEKNQVTEKTTAILSQRPTSIFELRHREVQP